jgi:hypothetical protein
MKREIKEAWLKRLENPEAKKARNMLSNARTGGMCCLGHLMAVCGIAEDHFRARSEMDCGQMPGSDFLRYVGLPFEDAYRLAKINDKKAGFPLDAIRALPVED